MGKQDLKSLLENIYHLLAEDAPPEIIPTEGDLIPSEEFENTPPDSRPRHLLSYFDWRYIPVLPTVGPWNGQWPNGFTPIWPPGIWPTQQLPPGDSPGSGFGGYWVQSPPQSPQWPWPQGYYYVYPPGKDGLFPAWLWNGKEFIQQVPSWGCSGHNCEGGGGPG